MATHDASDTTGKQLLLDVMKREGLTQTAIAEKLGCSQNSVSIWCRGLSRPEPHLREALELWLGIPKTSWNTAEESKFLADFRKSVTPVVTTHA